MNEDQVRQALRALAETDLERQAPPETEVRLLHEYHARRTRHGWRWPAIAAMAAGIVVAVLLVENRAPKQAVRTEPPPVSRGIEVAQPVPPSVALAAPRKVARRVARKVTSMRQVEPREIVTDFFPLMNPAPPFERGQILRVQLPASAMQTVGLPVSEEHLADPIQADVLVGEEGMPRAIRFVRFDVQ